MSPPKFSTFKNRKKKVSHFVMPPIFITWTPTGLQSSHGQVAHNKRNHVSVVKSVSDQVTAKNVQWKTNGLFFFIAQ